MEKAFLLILKRIRVYEKWASALETCFLAWDIAGPGRKHVSGAEEVAEKVDDFTEDDFCCVLCVCKTLKDFANVVCRAFWRVVISKQFLTAHKARLFQHPL